MIDIVPLPPELWTALPGRSEIVANYRLLGVPLPWLPLSLAPEYVQTETELKGLGIPFTILREIDLKVPLPHIKNKAIQELGYGANAKLILGFETRIWRTSG